eukprot:gnl/Trimastix_PCT/2505.p1 GENE.gnl/Trimastix_PCT/2505~~gnl/Trimastix_PCT/2505.p1  ORF type:complete len:195 (+),score=17.63 gnl/Trimastix_PCT/2505:61-645(+)
MASRGRGRGRGGGAGPRKQRISWSNTLALFPHRDKIPNPANYPTTTQDTFVAQKTRQLLQYYQESPFYRLPLEAKRDVSRYSDRYLPQVHRDIVSFLQPTTRYFPAQLLSAEPPRRRKRVRREPVTNIDLEPKTTENAAEAGKEKKPEDGVPEEGSEVEYMSDEDDGDYGRDYVDGGREVDDGSDDSGVDEPVF